MVGGSYGGGIQFIIAALDKRVDAIAPTIAWNSLVTSLYKTDTVKLGWGSACSRGSGIAASRRPRRSSARAGVQTGQPEPASSIAASTDGAATGALRDRQASWFADHGPDFLLSNDPASRR